MNSFRRFLVIGMWAFSFGGFVFYAGVVVPTGTRLLGSTTQGFVTREVTQALNIATSITLLLLAWEAVSLWRIRSSSANTLLTVMIASIALCTGILWFLHGQLDSMLAPEEMAVVDTENFYGRHRIYLWTSTLQWLCSLVVLWIVVNCPPTSRTPRLPD